MFHKRTNLDAGLHRRRSGPPLSDRVKPAPASRQKGLDGNRGLREIQGEPLRHTDSRFRMAVSDTAQLELWDFSKSH